MFPRIPELTAFPLYLYVRYSDAIRPNSESTKKGIEEFLIITYKLSAPTHTYDPGTSARRTLQREAEKQRKIFSLLCAAMIAGRMVDREINLKKYGSIIFLTRPTFMPHAGNSTTRLATRRSFWPLPLLLDSLY
jgi:hypothetical protein